MRAEHGVSLFLAAATALSLLPFVGKPIHVDDALFVWAAEHIRDHPLDPYGFEVNWYGAAQPMFEVTKNPPLASYWLAAIGALGGFGEVALHVGFLLPAIACVVATGLVARRLCRAPALAALATLFMPAFLVSATTLMSDIPMLALWMLALHFWLVGSESGRTGPLVAAAILAALCAVTKYFGLALVPILLAHALARRRRVALEVSVLLIPIAAAVAYLLATRALYGRGLLLDAATYVVAGPSLFPKLSAAKVLIAFAFTGGGAVAVLFFAPLLWRPAALLGGAAVAALVAVAASSAQEIAIFSLPADGLLRWSFAAQAGLLAVTGAAVLALAALDLYRRRDADALLLFLWVLGTFVFAGFLNWSTNGRSVLPLVPAVGILLARRLEALSGEADWRRRPSVLLALAASALVSFAVARGDARIAAAAKDAALDLARRYGGGAHALWFQGHWGFQLYLERAGAKPVDVQRSWFEPGDIVAVPLNNTNVQLMPAAWTRLREVVERPGAGFATTLDRELLGAGFYSDNWGPLPFAFGPAPDERVLVYEVGATEERPPS